MRRPRDHRPQAGRGGARLGRAAAAAALEAALDCYIGIDEAGLVVEFNAAAERTFGYARAEAIGRPMAELIVPPHLRAAHLRGLARHLAGGGCTSLGRRIEVDAMRADGSSSRSSSSIVRGEREAGAIFLAYLRDLTERRAAEKALAEREAQFRTIAESVPVGLVISEIDTGVPLYINPPAREQLGLGPDGDARLPARGLGRSGAARRAADGARRARARPAAIEADLVMPDGRRMNALFSATRIAYGGRDGAADRDRRHHRPARDRGGAAREPGAAAARSWTSPRSRRTCATPTAAT